MLRNAFLEPISCRFIRSEIPACHFGLVVIVGTGQIHLARPDFVFVGQDQVDALGLGVKIILEEVDGCDRVRSCHAERSQFGTLLIRQREGGGGAQTVGDVDLVDIKCRGKTCIRIPGKAGRQVFGLFGLQRKDIDPVTQADDIGDWPLRAVAAAREDVQRGRVEALRGALGEELTRRRRPEACGGRGAQGEVRAHFVAGGQLAVRIIAELREILEAHSSADGPAVRNRGFDVNIGSIAGLVG